MRKDLVKIRAKKEKLLEKRDLLNEEINDVLKEEKEIENDEVVVIFRKLNISIEDLMDKLSTKNKKSEKTDNFTSYEDTNYENKENDYE